MWIASEEEKQEARARLLLGLANGDDPRDLSLEVHALHRRHNTFPGEIFMYLATDALELTGFSRDEPLAYEGLLDRFLPEYRYRGRQNARIQYAVQSAAAVQGGLEPDLLSEIYWWDRDGTEVYWQYAFEAAVALIRASADRLGITAEEMARRLADHHGIG